ncbi:DUF2231 domain-containing protein [Cohnella rhizosphaerae]|uniref:DUF2231 domain-containing protein n=1 Tax=Cohnella rhizosphaerae TaxID=1457232 RepID=A0A9X4KXV1_9BACL|nr:DUF2231 domain-containing protein [Cohnella rhizosphaerae]MDG0812356.1 hypothetical protein [Cohnella rhizosphaerae]
MLNDIVNHAHPIFVHFPIVLITLGMLYDLVVSIRRRALPLKQGIWIWLAAVLSAWLSVATGPEDDARGNTSFLELHSTLADITAWVVSILVAARLFMLFRGKTSLIRFSLVAYLAVAVASCALVLGTGYYGGKMVYDNGIGVKVEGTPVNPPKGHHD